MSVPAPPSSVANPNPAAFNAHFPAFLLEKRTRKRSMGFTSETRPGRTDPAPLCVSVCLPVGLSVSLSVGPRLSHSATLKREPDAPNCCHPHLCLRGVANKQSGRGQPRRGYRRLPRGSGVAAHPLWMVVYSPRRDTVVSARPYAGRNQSDCIAPNAEEEYKL